LLEHRRLSKNPVSLVGVRPKPEEISMIPLHPQFITKNGKKEFAVIPYEEFATLQAFIADMEDLMDLRAAKQEDADRPSVPLAEVKKMLGL
jgi:hypothetical protein